MKLYCSENSTAAGHTVHGIEILDSVSGASLGRLSVDGQVLCDTRYDRYYVISGTTVYRYSSATDTITATWATSAANPFTSFCISADNSTIYLLEPLGRLIYKLSTADGSYSASVTYNYQTGTPGSVGQNLKLSPSGNVLFFTVNVDPANSVLDGAGQGDIFTYTLGTGVFVRYPNANHPVNNIPVSDTSVITDNSSSSISEPKLWNLDGAGGFASSFFYGISLGNDPLNQIEAGALMGNGSVLALGFGHVFPGVSGFYLLNPAITSSNSGVTTVDQTKTPGAALLLSNTGMAYFTSLLNQTGVYVYGIAGNAVVSAAVTAFPVFSFALGSASSVVPGCTDPNALNYNPSATVNDGSCLYTPGGGGGANSGNCANVITFTLPAGTLGEVQRATDAGFTQNLVTLATGLTAGPFVDTTMPLGPTTVYYYRVYAVSMAGLGTPVTLSVSTACTVKEVCAAPGAAYTEACTGIAATVTRVCQGN